MSPFCRGVSLRVGSYLGLPVSVLVQAAIAAAPLSSTKRDPLLTSRQLRLLTPGSALLENFRTLSLGCCSFGCQPRLLRRPRGEARVGGVPARSPPHGCHECVASGPRLVRGFRPLRSSSHAPGALGAAGSRLASLRSATPAGPWTWRTMRSALPGPAARACARPGQVGVPSGPLLPAPLVLRFYPVGDSFLAP